MVIPESKAIWQRLKEVSPAAVLEGVRERMWKIRGGKEGEGKVDVGKVFSVLGAVGFFVGFVKWHGIVQIVDTEEEDVVVEE